MANLPISGLTSSAANLASTDVTPVVQTAGVGPVKMTGLQLAGGLLGSATFNGATVTTSQPLLNLSQTWNAGAVTFTGLKFNATDTASASGSLLLDLQVGGTSQFNLNKSGVATFAAGSRSQPSVVFVGATTMGFWNDSNSQVRLSSGGVDWIGFNSATVNLPSANSINWAGDLYIKRAAAATLQLGAADAAAPVAQTLQVQSVVAGTTNTAGANFTIKGSAGTGTGAGGSLIFQVAPAGSSGTAQNAYATALTINSAQQAIFNAGTAALPSILFRASDTIGIYSRGAGVITISDGATYNMFEFQNTSGSNGAFNVNSGGAIQFCSGAAGSTGGDVVLRRDAANTLALRNGTNAQTFNVYKTYTDASNYAALQFQLSGSNALIQQYTAGTGGSLDLFLNFTNLRFATGGTDRWKIDSSGHFIAYADNTYDIGASGANRPRNVYVAGAVNVGSAVTAGTNLICGASYGVVWTTRSQLYSDANGKMTVTNQAGTDFTLFKFGGDTSSFPALKRSSAGLVVRLADDSADAALTASTVTVGGSGFVGFGTNNVIFSSSSGVLRLTNGTSDGFTGLMLGPSGTTYTRLKHGGTGLLQARLADDSAYAQIQGKLTTDTARTAGDPTTDGYLVIYDSTGTAYKVPCVAV